MTINWDVLQKKSDQFEALITETDPVSGLVDITYCGLYTKLSEVINNIPSDGAQSVVIYADTLVVDQPKIKTTGLIIIARCLDVSALQNNPLIVEVCGSANSIVQCMLGAVEGGDFKMVAAGHEPTVVSVPAGTSPLQAVLYEIVGDGALTGLPSGGRASVVDLLNRPLSLNSLQASYSAATWLMEDSDRISVAMAQSMFSWIVACTASLSSPQSTLPSNVSMLYNQAAALLITLNVAPGAIYVPVLSNQFYSDNMDGLVSVIGNYEGQIATLDTRDDIAKAIATVSDTLKGSAGDEITPLTVQLNNINDNTKSLFRDISSLRGDFLLQSQRAHTLFKVLEIKVSLDAIKQRLSAEMDMAMSVIGVGFDAVKTSEGDVGGLKDGISDAVDGIKSLVDTIEAGGEAGGGLTGTATALLDSQMALMSAILNGRLLWEQALRNQSGGVLPSNLGAITLDPVTSWDNYIASAQAEVDNIKRSLGDEAKAAVDTYFASLKILAGYGKAIGAKFVTYVSQLVKATVVIAQIQAAKDIQARWQAAEEKAKSESERLSLLKAMVQSRIESSKRSLFVSWTYYASSYFYLTFQQPPKVIHMDMNAADLKSALMGVSEWVAQAIGNAPDGQHIKLPSNHAQIELTFPILQPSGSVSQSDAAVLSRNASGNWELNFTVPLGTSQLQGVLPNNGRCAIWISAAEFYLAGVTPNQKGNVIAKVSTSGAYQNGVDQNRPYTFVTNGLAGDYAYEVADNKVYSPWQINTSVYMTPTPYTQWTIELDPNGGEASSATELTVKLAIAYLS